MASELQLRLVNYSHLNLHSSTRPHHTECPGTHTCITARQRAAGRGRMHVWRAHAPELSIAELQATTTASGAPFTNSRRCAPLRHATLISLRLRSNSSSASRGFCCRQCSLHNAAPCTDTPRSPRHHRRGQPSRAPRHSACMLRRVCEVPAAASLCGPLRYPDDSHHISAGSMRASRLCAGVCSTTGLEPPSSSWPVCARWHGVYCRRPP